MKTRIFFVNLIVLAIFCPELRGGEENVVIVRPGDTARKISRQYLIRPTSWERVVQYNYILKPGTAVKVPAELINVEGKAFLEFVRGGVSVKLAGEDRWIPALKGLVLRSGDRVRTDHDSTAELIFADHDRAILRSGTEIIFEYYRGMIRGRGNRLTVIRGEVLASGDGSGSHAISYEIKTPDSRGLLKGTILRIKVSKSGRTRFEVLSGELSVTTAGKTMMIPQDCGITIPPPQK